MKINIMKSPNFSWRYFLLKDEFRINRYWRNKIINIGFWSIYISIDMRKDWIKDWVSDMTFG